MFMEPPPSQWDLHFSVFGIPVRVHPWFWFVSLIMALRPDTARAEAAMWIGVVFFSILVHELGHALMIRRYGSQPWIVLYSFGGLAISRSEPRSTAQQVIISLAGPGAGFLLAALILSGIRLSGHEVTFVPSLFPVDFEFYESPRLNILLLQLLYVNIFWGVINLFPVYPLDGGQVARALFLHANPWDGLRQSLILSVCAAVGLVILAVLWNSMFMAMLFGYLGYLSYSSLNSSRGNPW